MSNVSQSDPFVGRWHLHSEESRYEMGQPPHSGIYVIEAIHAGYRFSAHWTDDQGENHRVSFEGVPDGQEYAYAESPMADTLTVTQVGAKQLDSTVKKAGEIIAHTARTLSEDGQTMTVVQSGSRPEGGHFANRAVYHKME